MLLQILHGCRGGTFSYITVPLDAVAAAAGQSHQVQHII